MRILFLILLTNLSFAARIKDIVDIRGIRSNQLIGYGLVVGLDGTGDSSVASQTSLARMYERLGLTIKPSDVKSKNVAAVMITAQINTFMRKGSKLDITVSSVGDAKSLRGGVLIMSPLRGGDQNVYAVAQGTVLVSDKLNLTVGQVPEGAVIEKEVLSDFSETKVIRLSLRQPDFLTNARISKTINEKLGGKYAHSVDLNTIDIIVPFGYEGRLVELMSHIETVDVDIDTPAKIVINERTGTVLIGKNVRISEVAISQDGLTIRIGEQKDPAKGKELVKLKRGLASTDNLEDRNRSSDGKKLGITRGASIDELVQGLNLLGVSSKDLISIFQSLKRIGALQAELEIL